MANNHGGKLRPSLRRPANRAPCGDLGGTPGLTSPPRLALCVPAEAQARRPPPAPGRPGGWGAPGGSRAPWLPSSERGRPRTPADTTKPGPDCPSQTTPTRDRYGRAPRARAPRPDGLGTRGGYPGPRVPQGCRGAPVPGTKTPPTEFAPPPPFPGLEETNSPPRYGPAPQGPSPPARRAGHTRGGLRAPGVPQGCRVPRGDALEPRPTPPKPGRPAQPSQVTHSALRASSTGPDPPPPDGLGTPVGGSGLLACPRAAEGDPSPASKPPRQSSPPSCRSWLWKLGK